MIWQITCLLRDGRMETREIEGTLKECRAACFGEFGRHNIKQVEIMAPGCSKVYDHFPLQFDLPRNIKGRIRLRLSRLSSGVHDARQDAVDAVASLLRKYGLELVPVLLGDETGRVVTGVQQGGETSDYILFEWAPTEFGNYTFQIYLL